MFPLAIEEFRERHNADEKRHHRLIFSRRELVRSPGRRRDMSLGAAAQNQEQPIGAQELAYCLFPIIAEN
jgi:hypothetical protein